MDLLATPEQEELARAAARLVGERFPRERLRAVLDAPCTIDEALWAAAAQAGWLGLGLPDSLGGAGGQLADEILIFRELGRGLASGPFLSTVLGARVAALGGLNELAQAVVAGQPVGLAVSETNDGAPQRKGEPDAKQLWLVDATGTEFVLLVKEAWAALYRLEDLEAVESVSCADPAVRLARAAMGDAVPLATVDEAVDPVWLRGQTLVAAMLTGIAELARDMAVEHAKSRIQFDRPIGVNQAVKHPCADMAVRCELAWAQTVVGALALDEGRTDAAFHALAAREVAGRAAEANAAAMLQIHGAMGFTFEHDAHLLVKRAFVLNNVLGGRREILARLIDLPLVT